MARGGIGGADENAVGMKEVVYGCSSGEKFGVGKDFECEIWAVDFELLARRISKGYLGGEKLNLRCLE